MNAFPSIGRVAWSLDPVERECERMTVMSDDVPKRADREPLDPAAPDTARVSRLRQLTPKAMWTTAVVIAVLTTAAVILLWWPATAGLNGADLVRARLDALKIGLSIGVGSGGVIALYLAWRRQHSTEADIDNRERVLAHQQEVAADTKQLQERVAEDTRLDATERRITELYTKAVEQLGSESAPVRLGGLYALERLAQGNESQRQTIVNVLCAYLRMPEPAKGEGAPDGNHVQSREYAQEAEVRNTAQRIITTHLGTFNNETYWGPCNLDLVGARLRDFTLRNCRVGSVDCSGATFAGNAFFEDTVFERVAKFDNATFDSFAVFGGCEYRFHASFDNATFRALAVFVDAKFSEDVSFTNAKFEAIANFENAGSAGSADFFRAVFRCRVSFSKVETAARFRISEAIFEDPAYFEEVKIGGKFDLRSARFDRLATFEGGRLGSLTEFADAKFQYLANFTDVEFVCDPDFSDCWFAHDPIFTGATLNGKRFRPPGAEADI